MLSDQIYSLLPDGLTMLQDELKSGEDNVVLDVEGYIVHNPEPPVNWVETLPLLGFPELGDPMQSKVSACFDWQQLCCQSKLIVLMSVVAFPFAILWPASAPSHPPHAALPNPLTHRFHVSPPSHVPTRSPITHPHTCPSTFLLDHSRIHKP